VAREPQRHKGTVPGNWWEYDMNSDLSGECRVAEGAGIVNSTARRFDQSHTNPPGLARVDYDVRFDKATAVASPHPTITRDTQIADVVVNYRGKRPECRAERWTHSHIVAW
jgi:hypothetical protein